MPITTTAQFSTQYDWAALVGRILLALIFIMSGFNKIGGFEGTAGYIASKGLPMPQVLAAATILVELGGGILLVVGWKARWAALAIAGSHSFGVHLPQLLDVPARAADEPVQQLLEEHRDRRRHADGSRVRAGTLRRRQELATASA